jgi:hypothetical protein
MGNKTRSNQNPRKEKRLQALDLFTDKFLELHPKETWPDWFTSHTDIVEVHASDNKCRLAISAFKKRDLRSNEWYEEVHGKDVLTKLDPDTQEKRYVINTPESEVLDIFGAIIDLETFDCNIVVDEDMSSIDVKRLRKLR